MLLAHKIELRPTPEQAVYLDNAFSHFFRRVKAKQKGGFPRFKKKDVRDNFALREVAKFDVVGRELRIEKLKTKIEMCQALRFQDTPRQITISKRAGKYFASILVETNDYSPNDINRQTFVGVDFGIKELAKKVKGSNRRAKAKLTIQKLYFRIANQRQALLHELSNYLTKNFDVITIEDSNVKGRVKNRKLSRAISDVGFGYLRQMIEYKATLKNCVVVVANRFFPSSKTCSCCGKIKMDLTLTDRQFACECGFSADRDLNAVLNLNKYGLDTLTA